MFKGQNFANFFIYLAVGSLLTAAAACRGSLEGDESLLREASSLDRTTLSYGELASAELTAFFDEITLEKLPNIGDKVMPHDLKCLRKEIGYLKILVDLFPYAYLPTPKKADDVLLQLRDDLDEGYEIIGKFKDEFDKDPDYADKIEPYQDASDKCLFSVPSEINSEIYSKKTVDEKRKEVEKWVTAFLKPKTISQYRGFIVAAEPKITDRKKSRLSRFYWGGVLEVPENSLSGVDNIKLLQASLVGLAAIELKRVVELKTIHKEEDEEAFHDFRKRIRSVLRVDLFFPEAKNDGLQGKEKLKSIENFVEGFGAINDLFIRYHSLKEEKDDENDKKIDKLKDQINDSWKDLRDKIVAENFKDDIAALKDLFAAN